jgi:hypothetical protein|tara:strand:+ start:3612 stop:3824 length:213 start_codon:yes stop_codon:yes gene_type:complete
MSEYKCLSCGRFTSVKPRHVVIGKGEGWTPFVSSCCVSEYESWIVKKYCSPETYQLSIKEMKLSIAEGGE